MYREVCRIIAGVCLIAGGWGFIEIDQSLYGCGIFICCAEIGNMMTNK
jgi:hypothetical protein|tara:strand:- start:57 stop:200 length:144 start_codon:yes stop_codon:yes gene_type:complete